MTNPYEFINSTGTIVPDTSEILSGINAEYQTIFGTDLQLTPDSPQGVLIAAEALARSQVVQNNAALANQINPNIAGGVFLDAILALTGMQRTPATQTLVKGVTLNGVPGTVIPEGAQAKTAVGDIFATLSPVTLAANGQATVDFVSVAFGPIPCLASALNIPVTNVLGWETVNNSVAGVVGTTTQSDIGARALRSNTLAFQGVSLAESITSALFAVPGVQSLFFQENISATTQVIKDITMVGHSIYVCVNGGSDLNVAAAMLENKSSGCAWNGNTSVSVTEPTSGQIYTVLFDRPAPIEIAIQVTSANAAIADIQTGIANYIAGNVANYPAWSVGQPISAFEIAGALLSQYPYMIINQVQISYASSIEFGTAVLPIAVNQIGFSNPSDITLVLP
jgi:hypothetical protein